MADGSVAAQKLEHFSTFDAGHEADWTDGPTMHFESTPFKVNEIRRLTEVVCTRRHSKERCDQLILRRYPVYAQSTTHLSAPSFVSSNGKSEPLFGKTISFCSVCLFFAGGGRNATVDKIHA